MTPYVPVTDFSDDEATQQGGRSTVDTSGLDAELAALQNLTDAMIGNIDLVVRSDGKLQDQIVELHTLHPDIINDIAANLINAGNLNSDVHFVQDTGSADAIVGVITPAPESYFSGLAVWVRMAASVTGGPVTANFNGLGNASVKQGDGTTDPAVGEPQINGIAYLVYDGSVFQHINKSGSAAGLSAHLADLANPHAVTFAQTGLAAGDPTDTDATRDKVFSNLDIKGPTDYVAVGHLPLGGGTVTGPAIFSGALTASALTTLDQVDLTDRILVNDDTIVAATTTDLATMEGNSISVTGSTGIVGWGTVAAGAVFWITFTGSPNITHNPTSNILPTGASIAAQPGDTCVMQSLGAGDWKMLSFQRISGAALIDASLEDDHIGVQIVDASTSVVTGSNFAFFTIPWTIGRTLIEVHAEVFTAGTTGVSTVDINKNGTSMLSTKITIDSGETGSDTAVIPAVIDLDEDEVVENDRITIDVDGVSSTAPLGLFVRLTFEPT